MTWKTECKKIQSKIEEAKSILILSHQNPDGDAMGCLTAFCQYAHSLRKNYWAFCEQMPPKNFRFLPFREKISNTPFIPLETVDLAMVFDCSDLSRIGNKDILKELSVHKTPIINIDHHHTNTSFGIINIVLPEASSTSEILYRYFQETQFSLNKNLAFSLLYGIVSDTNTFTNHNTTPETLEISAQLLRSGTPLATVIEGMYKNKNVRLLKRWGRVLSQIYINKKFHGAVAILPLDEKNKEEDDPTETEGLTDYLKALCDVKWAIVIKEMRGGLIKGSIRTNSDLIDVSKLATLLGGGGHRKAAGFTISGKLAEVEGRWKII